MKMKEKIISFVMHNKFLYSSYYYVLSSLLRLIKFFVRPDDHLVLFVSFGGRFYNDSPKCLYEAMKKDPRFRDYRFVWAFRSPREFPEVENRVRIDTIRYFIIALKARCWITNNQIERGLDFKGKNTFYLNTTHTVLPKLTASRINKDITFTSKATSKCDCYTVQSEYERTVLGGDENRIKVVGYPKSDILANYTDSYRQSLRKKLDLPNNKTVILYAPTFREGSLRDIAIPVDFSKWRFILGEEYIVLFRAHPVVALKVKIDEDSSFVRDVSSYPDNNELIIASDILISDYSGIFFEFGVQSKPMFVYAYDYEEYNKTRGLYFDIRQELPGGGLNEEELLLLIRDGDKTEIMQKVEEFRQKYITAYGHATELSLDIIYDHLCQ